ncbi:MAG TPA: manganese efflux pump MntP family protein [Bacteroidales bacterium]|nr:manganese efflux pump MntP family protein [Bacteroidales bacterium]HSA43480.1 manganese efflux pump MntP family protein [Bacteroidales bacterium]
MELYTLFLISLGLCFDTFAVSVGSGIARTSITFRQALRISLLFAMFQALMPVLGWLIGREIAILIHEADHWVAFGLLFLLGMKMILEGMKQPGQKRTTDPLDLRVQLMLAVATSIDALVVGVSFGTLDVHIVTASAMIGILTFLVSMIGILFGKKTGRTFGHSMEIAGGVILILIGLKILVEHLAA